LAGNGEAMATSNEALRHAIEGIASL